MINQQVNSTKTEPVQINYDQMKGPFQYAPFTIDHPGQPEDDFSVKDPTVKTLDRSRLCLSPFNVNHEVSFLFSFLRFLMKGFPSSKNQATFNYWHSPKKVKRLLKVSRIRRNSNPDLQNFSKPKSTSMKKQGNIPIFLIWANRTAFHHVINVLSFSCPVAQFKTTQILESHLFIDNDSSGYNHSVKARTHLCYISHSQTCRCPLELNFNICKQWIN
ncbi:unnamed protein product (macronuclear) [Paramecium tetraurelia]|uniref:Uncharacterized protein n=1 Tax=Paramecium tetraurelia TaxID=5888 RepID=A0CEF8_PARTE|nr:uncharacterized protein GSPATT00037612001 [Paramecium tetraurelia]CAK69175.1 unnamed protein product [Paramecium tetraurelia]|eukprot:XP_001436572.1 hypothetical protein (macronuclear) [Paramecium tetraurelia strain d4-2]